VLTIILSFVITAPYLRLRHVALVETALAMFMKYSSHPGLLLLFLLLGIFYIIKFRVQNAKMDVKKAISLPSKTQ
jgi:hypothetical protein